MIYALRDETGRKSQKRYGGSWGVRGAEGGNGGSHRPRGDAPRYFGEQKLRRALRFATPGRGVQRGRLNGGGFLSSF